MSSADLLPPVPNKLGKYTLTLEVCPQCNGEGQIVTPMAEPYKKWLRKKGWGDTIPLRQCFFKEQCGLKEVPQWLLTCPKCKGKGGFFNWEKIDNCSEEQLKKIKGDKSA